MYFSIIVSAICSSEVSSLEKDGSSMPMFSIENQYLRSSSGEWEIGPNPSLEEFLMLGHKHYFFIFLIEGYIASVDSEVRVETILLFICLKS